MDARSGGPLISVITVCLNSETTLARTLQSVADQDWPRVEHIIVDGGSSDGTLDIIGRFDRHLSAVISEPDRGIYDAMNKGLNRSSGDIVCFLNADDEYASGTVLSRVAGLMEEQKLDALLGDVVYFDEARPERIVRRYRSDRFTPDRLAWGWMPAHPALFLSRGVVDRVGGFKTDYRIAGDFEYIVRAFHGQNLIYRNINEVLVRMQMGGLSTRGWRSTVQLNVEVLRACRENGVPATMPMILSKYPRKLLEFVRH